MEQKALYRLSIDSSFSTLIHPLSKDELLRLEENLLRDGCIDPIVVWNGTIVDGHHRYALCSKHEIPFEIKRMYFSCKQEAIAWICANQLGRRNISAETRRYLIGKQYEAEKVTGVLRNKWGNNQHRKMDGEHLNGQATAMQPSLTRHVTAQRIADENNISVATVARYGSYSRAIDQLERKAPDLVHSILAGEQKLTQGQIVELSTMKPSQIKKATERAGAGNPQASAPKRPTTPVYSGPSVKDMPKHDPDGEMIALTLTIPSWQESIERVISVADLESVSADAKDKAQKALSSLVAAATSLLTFIKETKMSIG